MTLFFPRLQETSPFFQLINEIERSSRPTPPKCQPKQRTFTPSFDVKETKDTYQLYGELPGVAQSDVNIEWADDKTITISGRSERKYKKSSVAPAVAVEDTKAVEAETTPAEDGFEEITNDQASYQKPTVEDEQSDTTSTTTAAPSETEKSAVPEHHEAHKYWFAERSVGTFERTFQFPVRVEHDAVKASLKNGILSVTIPKAKPLEPRKITIE